MPSSLFPRPSHLLLLLSLSTLTLLSCLIFILTDSSLPGSLSYLVLFTAFILTCSFPVNTELCLWSLFQVLRVFVTTLRDPYVWELSPSEMVPSGSAQLLLCHLYITNVLNVGLCIYVKYKMLTTLSAQHLAPYSAECVFFVSIK